MLKLPIFTLPNFSQPFEVTTDASGLAIGAVLSQNYHPIAFFNKKLTPRMAATSTYVTELYALTKAVNKWCQYLLGNTLRYTLTTKALRA